MIQENLKDFQGVQLQNFNWDIVGVIYDWKSSTAKIEVEACEIGKTQTHSRFFEFPCDEEWTSETALIKLQTLDTFND